MLRELRLTADDVVLNLGHLSHGLNFMWGAHYGAGSTQILRERFEPAWGVAQGFTAALRHQGRLAEHDAVFAQAAQGDGVVEDHPGPDRGVPAAHDEPAAVGPAGREARADAVAEAAVEDQVLARRGDALPARLRHFVAAEPRA